MTGVQTCALPISGLDGPEAQSLRSSLRALAPEETAASFAGLDTPESWAWREELKHEAPIGVIKSLPGTERGRADLLVTELLAAHPHRLRVAREAVQFRMNAICTTTSI